MECDRRGQSGSAGGLEDDVGLAAVDVCGVDQGAFGGVFCYADVPFAPAGEFDFKIAWFALERSRVFGVEVVVCFQEVGHDDCIFSRLLYPFTPGSLTA